MRSLRWILLLLVVVVVAVVLRLTVLRPRPVEVRTARVGRGAVEETVTNTRAGTVKVRRRASLSPQLGGLVVALPFREGAEVKAGDLLLRLDDQAQQADLELAQRSVRLAEAQSDEACLAAELAEKELRRGTALHGEGIASEQNLDTLSTERDRTRAACAAARAAVTQSQAKVALARVQVGFTELRAPFDGVIATLSTEVGEWITPSPPGVPIPPVIDLLDSQSVYVSAPIDEVDSERVATGQPVRITVDSRPDQELEGRVERVAPFVLDAQEQNRTVEVEVAFADAKAAQGVLPGTSADVEIILARRSEVLRLPAQAVGEGGTVMVLEHGVLAEKTISVGLSNWEWAEVMDGLAEGDVVVTSRASTDVKIGARAVAADGGDG